MAELLQLSGVESPGESSTPQQRKITSDILLDNLRNNLHKMICDNPLISASKMSAKGMGDLFETFFGGF